MERPRDARLATGCLCKNGLLTLNPLGFPLPPNICERLQAQLFSHRGKRAADNTTLPCCCLKCLPDSLPPCSGPDLGVLKHQGLMLHFLLGMMETRRKHCRRRREMGLMMQDLGAKSLDLLAPQPEHYLCCASLEPSFPCLCTRVTRLALKPCCKEYKVDVQQAHP